MKKSDLLKKIPFVVLQDCNKEVNIVIPKIENNSLRMLMVYSIDISKKRFNSRNWREYLKETIESRRKDINKDFKDWIKLLD